MSTEDRASAAISRLSGITTEMAARRELRDRSAESARAAARESMAKIGPMAEKVAQRLGEMARRQRGAGGWATRNTLADKEPVYGFGPEEDEAAEDEYARFAAPAGAVPENAEPDTIGVLAEEDSRPAEPPRREVQAAASGRRRAASPGAEEDDDFSAMPSWLKE